MSENAERGDRRDIGDGIETSERARTPPPFGVDEVPSDPDLGDAALYLNRELSELAYQQRVLQIALDDRTPLLERVRFLSIFTRNMDEFVMKRVGGLKQQIEAGITERTPDGRTPTQQWEAVHETMEPMFAAQTECYELVVKPALAEAGIHLLEYDGLDTAEREHLREYFEESVLPTLTPLSFDPAHPFPFISNRSLSLAILTRQDGEDLTFTRVKIPPNRPRLVELEAGRYVLIEDVIRANLDLLLPNVEIVDTALFRLTRNAEVRRDEEVAEDLIDMIEEVLEQRRFATVVRLEIEAGVHPAARETLKEQLDLTEREIYERDGPLDYREFDRLLDLDRPDLKPPSWTPQPHPRLDASRSAALESSDGGDIFSQVKGGDVLLHHPYHDFTATVQRFLEEAAADPDVLAVKAAIYRTASDSQVIQSLIDAAENGKQVAVMVELKARFDEQNNLEWVRKLEEHGIHVAYGTIGLKTHTKTALVVREESDGVQLYSHVGTGNYHSKTAKGYVDLGLLTADRDVGRDLVKVFNFFTGPALDEEFRKLLIAPVTMRERFTRYIRNEAAHARAGQSARIVAKVNGLEDPAIVRELYRASQAGVEIDLVVRDICRLRPGVEGVSERIRVHSVVGRFLEHSRIFYFENGASVDPDATARRDERPGDESEDDRTSDERDGDRTSDERDGDRTSDEREPAARAERPGARDADGTAGPQYLLGSADWMTRNLDHRVEAVTPVEDARIRRQLKFVLELLLADNRRRWRMHPDGSYEQCHPDGEEAIDTQAVLMDQTRQATADEDAAAGLAPPYPIDGDLLVDGHDGDGAQRHGGEMTTVPVGGRRSEEAPSADSDVVLDRHGDRWYEPDSETYAFAVRTPEGGRVYRKTAAGAAAVLERHYE